MNKVIVLQILLHLLHSQSSRIPSSKFPSENNHISYIYAKLKAFKALATTKLKKITQTLLLLELIQRE